MHKPLEMVIADAAMDRLIYGSPGSSPPGPLSLDDHAAAHHATVI
jgi:hypothetical protein